MTQDALKSWIKSCERLELQLYTDTTGNPTIGWGHNLKDGIRLDEATLIFENDFNQTLKELLPFAWFTKQSENVQSALINMNFNLGIERLLEFKKMIEALDNNDLATAANEALNSSWAKEVGTRARDVALMIRQG